MPRASAELRAELDALADASAKALALLRAGDESGVQALLERREGLIGALARSSAEADESVMDAARRAVALDTELVAALRLRLAGMGREVEDMMRTRRSLVSYSAPAAGALFVERLG